MCCAADRPASPQLCHLLALITRRRHVRPFRIQALLELSRITAGGGDPSLFGLLRIYKDYYPEIVLGEAIHGRATVFKHPDPQWGMRLADIRHAHAEAIQDSTSSVQHGFRVFRQIGRKKKSVVPGVRTTQATEVWVAFVIRESLACMAWHPMHCCDSDR